MNWISAWRAKNARRPYEALADKVIAQLSSLQMQSDVDLKGSFYILKAALQSMPPEASKVEQQIQAYALIAEGCRRVLGKAPFRAQLVGAFVLADHAIAEMRTGEGKTLVAPFAAMWHFLNGRKVHISTANAYLAERDANAMYPLYQFFDVLVAARLPGATFETIKNVYRRDVVYGMEQLFAHDYLNTQLARSRMHELVTDQDALILDEADVALIDSAKTPIQVTTTLKVHAERYKQCAAIAALLVRGDAETANSTAGVDFYLDPETRRPVLTEASYSAIYEAFVDHGLLSADDEMYGTRHQDCLQMLQHAITANYVLQRDVDYVVEGDHIVLIDALTGRLMPGRSWDGGLQQALETKEDLEISDEHVVLGTISLQNFIKLYKTVSGMTGTAKSDEEELQAVYGLAVVQIQPNKPSKRVDLPDRFFRTQASKLDAVVAAVQESYGKGQPILIGTASVAQSEEVSARLTSLGLPHNVLNAKHHSREAEIFAKAGAPYAITVTTNMAGRGVDIPLGGSYWDRLRKAEQEAAACDGVDEISQEVLERDVAATILAEAEFVRELGGLRIIGLERYESLRQDMQLRGRAGRQGDPGTSEFFVSLDEPMIEAYAGQKIRQLFTTFDVAPGDEVEGALVLKLINNAQREVEARAAAVRKALMTYDNVLDEQRRVIYTQRQEILHTDNNEMWLRSMIPSVASSIIAAHLKDAEFGADWVDAEALQMGLRQYGVVISAEELRECEPDNLEAFIIDAMESRFNSIFHAGINASEAPEDDLREPAARYAILMSMDQLWVEHLDTLSYLQKGIHLRQHAKEDPQRAYKRDAFKFFGLLLEAIPSKALNTAMILDIKALDPAESA